MRNYAAAICYEHNHENNIIKDLLFHGESNKQALCKLAGTNKCLDIISVPGIIISQNSQWKIISMNVRAQYISFIVCNWCFQ